MADVIIRKAAKQDLELIAELEALCFSGPWTANMIENDLCSSMAVVNIAEEGGKAAGYSIVGIIPNVSGELNRIGVNPAFRRKGIARALMDAMVSDCKAVNAEEILLEVREGNTPAIELYKSFNFTVDGIRPKYYDGKDDAVLMSLKL